MKQKFHYACFLLLAAAAFIACEKETNNGNIIDEVEITESQNVLTFEGAVNSPQTRSFDGEAETRVYMSDDDAPRFDYTDNLAPTAYFLFKQGTRTAKQEAVIDIDQSKLTYKVQIPVPSGFSLSPSDAPLYVSGAFGVNGMDDNGNIDIAAPGTLVPNSQGRVAYQVPMYFPLTEVNKAGRHIGANFQLFGSFLALKLTASDLLQAYTPKGIFVKSAAFSLTGRMNINTTGDAQWTPGTITSGDGHHLQMDGISVSSTDTEPKTVYVWMKPSATPGENVELYVANYSLQTDIERLRSTYDSRFGVNRKPSNPFADQNSYRIRINFESDLIFTQYYYTLAGTGWLSYYNIYNPTSNTIDLNGYYFVRENPSNEGGVISILDLGNLKTLASDVLHADRPNVLPAGQSLVLGPYRRWISPWEVGMMQNAYNIYNLGGNDTALTGESWSAHYITKGGTSRNHIVDNLGINEKNQFYFWDGVSHFRNDDANINRPHFQYAEWKWRGLTKTRLGQRTVGDLSSLAPLDGDWSN